MNDINSNPESAPTEQVVIADPSAFKLKRAGRPLQLPSGLVILASRVELKTFLKAGSIPNGLVPIIEKALNTGNEPDLSPEDMTLDQMQEMYTMVEVVCCGSFVQPTLRMLEDGVEPLPTQLYTHEVDEEDKMFVYQWATGGTADIATFREEASADLAPLAASQGAQLPPE